MLQVPEEDLFDGITVKTHHGLRFVDRDQIAEITTTLVRCSLTDEEAAALPAPRGLWSYDPDTARDEGPSLTARFGRLFGREHWKELNQGPDAGTRLLTRFRRPNGPGGRSTALRMVRRSGGDEPRRNGGTSDCTVSGVRCACQKPKHTIMPGGQPG